MGNPQRTCISCRKIKDKKVLLRIVKSAEGDISVDVTGRKNGRGAYICRSEECFGRLKKTGGLERSFKMSLPEEIYDRLSEEFKEIKED